jgi:hypothetical protein
MGEVYSYDYDGNETYNFILPDEPRDALFAWGVALRGTSFHYLTENNKYRIHGFDNSATSHVDLGAEPLTMPSLNSENKTVFVVVVPGMNPGFQLQYFDGTAFQWDNHLGGNATSKIAIDDLDRMYFSTFLGGDSVPTNGNGIHCVLTDQTESWFYPLENEFAGTVIIGNENLLLATTTGGLFSQSDETTKLLGIRGN